MNDARWRWVGLGAITLLAGVFGFLNSGERVAVHLGALVLYQVPLVVLVFSAFLLGMITMFLLGLRHDLEVRRELREREHRPVVYSPPPPPLSPPSAPEP